MFIDDYDGDISLSNKPKPKLNKRKKIIVDESHLDSNSSGDEITFQKKYVRKKTDSLDHFGKYLVSLLKKLPKELSNQLQIDFVKQVMNSQLTYESQQKPITVPSNGYAITITESQNNTQEEVQYLTEEVIEGQ